MLIEPVPRVLTNEIELTVSIVSWFVSISGNRPKPNVKILDSNGCLTRVVMSTSLAMVQLQKTLASHLPRKSLREILQIGRLCPRKAKRDLSESG